MYPGPLSVLCALRPRSSEIFFRTFLRKCCSSEKVTRVKSKLTRLERKSDFLFYWIKGKMSQKLWAVQPIKPDLWWFRFLNFQNFKLEAKMFNLLFWYQHTVWYVLRLQKWIQLIYEDKELFSKNFDANLGEKICWVNEFSRKS